MFKFQCIWSPALPVCGVQYTFCMSKKVVINPVKTCRIETQPHLQPPPEGRSSCAAPKRLHQTPSRPSSPAHSLKHHIITRPVLVGASPTYTQSNEWLTEEWTNQTWLGGAWTQSHAINQTCALVDYVSKCVSPTSQRCSAFWVISYSDVSLTLELMKWLSGS